LVTSWPEPGGNSLSGKGSGTFFGISDYLRAPKKVPDPLANIRQGKTWLSSVFFQKMEKHPILPPVYFTLFPGGSALKK
jgi:hypothetical protein